MLQSGTRCPVLWVMLRLENNPVAKSYCTSTVRPFELLLTMYIPRHHSCSTTLLMHSSPSLQLLVPARSICNENFKPCKCSGQHRMVALAPVITLAFGRSYLSIHMPLPPWPYLEPSGLLISSSMISYSSLEITSVPQTPDIRQDLIHAFLSSLCLFRILHLLSSLLLSSTPPCAAQLAS